MKTVLFFPLFLAIIFVGCYQDKGNYTYTENEVITVTGIDDRYSRIFMQERLVIDPGVKSSLSGAEFDCFWIISTNIRRLATDTISRENKLDIPVDLDPNNTYWLLFSATNRETGYTTYKFTELIVTTPFSYGFCVLKDNGSQSDIDLYDNNANVITDIIELVNGRSVRGTGVRLSYSAGSYKFDEEKNTYVKARSINVLTSESVMLLDASKVTVMRQDEGYFFETPTVISPTFQGECAYTQLLINDGKAYSIDNQSLNNGRYGMPKTMPDGRDHHISRYVHNDYVNHYLVFDDVSSSFLFVSNALGQFQSCKDSPGTELSCTGNNKRMIYLGARAPSSELKAFAVMEDKTDGKKLLARLDLSDRKNMTMSITVEELADDDEVANAELRTLSFTEEVMYYVYDGKLRSRNLATEGGLNTTQFTIPATEQAITIKSMRYNEAGIISLNHLALITTNGNGYKVRLFPKTTAGNINSTPEFTFPAEGFAPGKATDVIYNSPRMSISSNTLFTY